MVGGSVYMGTLLPNLVDVDCFKGQLPQALPAVPVALGGGGHAPTPRLASRSMLKVHGAGLGASGDKENLGERRAKDQNIVDTARTVGWPLMQQAGKPSLVLYVPDWILPNL